MLNLTQTLPRGDVYSASADGVVDRVHADGSISRSQDVTDILKENAACRNGDSMKGFRIAPTFRRVASIPVAAIDIAKAQGMDILNDHDALLRFLNDPNNAAFRTTTERV